MKVLLPLLFFGLLFVATSAFAAPNQAPVAVDEDLLTARKSPSERFQLADQVFYLHAPDGIGRSKLAASVEKLLGVTVTARNWRTVQKLAELVEIT